MPEASELVHDSTKNPILIFFQLFKFFHYSFKEVSVLFYTTDLNT